MSVRSTETCGNGFYFLDHDGNRQDIDGDGVADLWRVTCSEGYTDYKAELSTGAKLSELRSVVNYYNDRLSVGGRFEVREGYLISGQRGRIIGVSDNLWLYSTS